MKTEDFWDKYLNEDALELFETVYDFFSKELPKEFIEGYDVGEVILETKGGLEVAKEFEKVIKFSTLIKNKQPKLYKEYFQYFDDFLIDYYCFTNEPKEVEEAFSNFISNPIQDIDQYLILLKKILFYGYSDIINEAIIKNFNEISTSDELIGYAEYDLAMIKFYTTLEDFYQKSNTIAFENEIFIKTLQGYGFDFDNDFLSALKKGIQEQISKELILSSFYNDRKNFIVTLEIYFLRYMQERNFSFALSGKLWDKLLVFWSDNISQKKCSPETYFKVNVDDFEKYILSLNSDMFIDNKSEMIAVLWGSVYVYDFLNYIEIINKTSFNNFIEISKVIKGKVINNYISELWNYNFIHLWKKPDSITTTEFVEEEKIFKKSFSLKHKKFTILRSEISKELNNIGELSKYIIEGKEIKRHNMFDFLNDKQNLRLEEDRITKPIIAEKKVGRNEPCPCGSGKKFKKCCGK